VSSGTLNLAQSSPSSGQQTKGDTCMYRGSRSPELRVTLVSVRLSLQTQQPQPPQQYRPRETVPLPPTDSHRTPNIQRDPTLTMTSFCSGLKTHLLSTDYRRALVTA